MVETKRAFLVPPGFEDKAGFPQPRQGRSQIILTCADNRRERRVRELPAQNRGNLSNLFGATQAVKPRHQRIPQRQGNSASIRGVQIQDGLCQFLNEQRHPVTTGNDLLDQRLVHFYSTGNVLYECDALFMPDLLATDQRRVGMSGPVRLEFGAMSNYDERSFSLDASQQSLHQGPRRLIAPMSVFKHQKHRAVQIRRQ